MNDLVIFRGGGDVISGSIQKFFRTGERILILDIEKPTTVRRTVSFSEAVYEGRFTLEGITSVLVHTKEEMEEAWRANEIPVVIDPTGIWIEKLKPLAVIDGIIAKRNLGTHRGMAPITIALGPGFEAGVDCDIVIETNRGHNLSRLIFEGCAAPNTGIPGNISGFTEERVLRSPAEGIISNRYDIGQVVKKGELLSTVENVGVYATLTGRIRGMIRDGSYVTRGMKIGDIDPRISEHKNAVTISDKARAIGGGVLEAYLILKHQRGL